MIKAIGAAMIIISCSALGISLNRDMRLRYRAVKNHIEALNIIKSELLYKNSPLGQIVALLDKRCDGRAGDFYRMTFTFAQKGLTFSKAAEKNYKMLKKSALTADDIDAIREVCTVLGRYDASAQVEMINRAVAKLEGNLASLKEEMSAKGKLYKAIGATTGIVIALIVI